MEHNLATVDALASQFIAWATPVRFDVAQSPAELDSVYRVRYQIAIERGWATPTDLPHGIERDTYDNSAVQIVGWVNEQPIALARLVFPSPGLRLPTEETFKLVIEPHGQVVDINRATVLAAYSDLQHRVFCGLLGRSWLEIRTRGFQHVCAYAAQPLLRLYRILGLQFTQLGPSQIVWGEVRTPICFDIAASTPLVTSRLGRSTDSAAGSVPNGEASSA